MTTLESKVKDIKRGGGRIAGGRNPKKKPGKTASWIEFKTPEELFDYINENCVKCDQCGNLISLDIANEMGIDHVTGREYYLCDGCIAN